VKSLKIIKKGRAVLSSKIYRGSWDNDEIYDKIIRKQTLEPLNPGILDPY
jgi:hypothetical protein